MKFNPFRNNSNKQLMKELQELKVAIMKNSLIPRIKYQGFIVRDRKTKQALGGKNISGFFVFLDEKLAQQQLDKIMKTSKEDYEVFPVDVVYTEERQEQ
jgi:hypothetical protein